MESAAHSVAEDEEMLPEPHSTAYEEPDDLLLAEARGADTALSTGNARCSAPPKLAPTSPRHPPPPRAAHWQDPSHTLTVAA